MYIDINNVKLYYDVVGTGSPLILIHGNGESHEIFDEAVKLLSEHFTCYLLDSRGHGQSQKVSEYHYADMAEELVKRVKAVMSETIEEYMNTEKGRQYF